MKKMKYTILALVLISTFCFVSLQVGLVGAQQSAATVKGEADAPSFQLYPKRVEVTPGAGYQIKMTTSTPTIYNVNTLTVTISYPFGWYWDTSTQAGTYVIEGSVSDNPIILSLDQTLLGAFGNSVTDFIRFTCPIDTPAGDYKIIAVHSIGYTDIATNSALTKFGREEVTVTVTSTAAMGEAKKSQQQVEQAQAKIIEAQGRISMAEGMLTQAKAAGKDVSVAEVTLNQAKASLQLAQSTVNSNPTTALANANNALAMAQNAETMISQATKTPLPTGVAVIAIAIAAAGIILKRRK